MKPLAFSLAVFFVSTAAQALSWTNLQCSIKDPKQLSAIEQIDKFQEDGKALDAWIAFNSVFYNDGSGVSNFKNPTNCYYKARVEDLKPPVLQMIDYDRKAIDALAKGEDTDAFKSKFEELKTKYADDSKTREHLAAPLLQAFQAKYESILRKETAAKAAAERAEADRLAKEKFEADEKIRLEAEAKAAAAAALQAAEDQKQADLKAAKIAKEKKDKEAAKAAEALKAAEKKIASISEHNQPCAALFRTLLKGPWPVKEKPISPKTPGLILTADILASGPELLPAKPAFVICNKKYNDGKQDVDAGLVIWYEAAIPVNHTGKAIAAIGKNFISDWIPEADRVVLQKAYAEDTKVVKAATLDSKEVVAGKYKTILTTVQSSAKGDFTFLFQMHYGK